MLQDWIKQKERHKNTSKVSFALISVLLLTLGFAAAKVPLKNGVQYTVITDLPKTVILDQTYTMRVDSINVDTVTYEVLAGIKITGPKGFGDKDIRIVWVTYDKNWNVLTRFILGRGGTQHFAGEGSITWTGTGTLTMPGDYRIHVLNVTVLGSAPLGNYEACITVLGETIRSVLHALFVTISPSSATLYVGQCQLFTSSVTGGASPCTYQWYLNGAAVCGATGSTWAFTPTCAGCYTVYVKVTDSTGTQGTSNTATVARALS